MKIRLDDKHYLNSDAFCYWITCEYEIKEGKRAGSAAERRVSGYTATFTQAVDSFVERRIKAAEIDDFTELVKIVDDLKTEVMSWKLNVDKVVANRVEFLEWGDRQNGGAEQSSQQRYDDIPDGFMAIDESEIPF